MGITQNTIYKVWKRFKEGVGAKWKSGSGRPAVNVPSKQANKMIRDLEERWGLTGKK